MKIKLVENREKKDQYSVKDQYFLFLLRQEQKQIKVNKHIVERKKEKKEEGTKRSTLCCTSYK